MPIGNPSEIKEKIISFLRIHGPSLPVHIARETEQSILFASAFLSELVSEKTIKITDMKVGNSPVYFLPNQESRLERFGENLKSKEKEAFQLLKEKKILQDKKQEPSIRVALRSIKDFAKAFKKDDEIYWRYFLVSEEQTKEKLPKKVKQTTEKKESKELDIFNKKTKEKPKQRKISKKKSGFVLKIIDSLNNKGIRIKEEIKSKKKEYNAIVKINSQLGELDFFLRAKDKKRVSVDDLMDLIKNAKSKNMCALLLFTGKLSKGAEEYALEKENILKIKKVEK